VGRFRLLNPKRGQERVSWKRNSEIYLVLARRDTHVPKRLSHLHPTLTNSWTSGEKGEFVRGRRKLTRPMPKEELERRLRQTHPILTGVPYFASATLSVAERVRNGSEA